MNGNRGARLLCAVLAALTLFLTVPAARPASAASLGALQKQQAELKKKKSQVDTQIKSLKNDKARQQQYKDAILSQIKTVQEQIDNLDGQIGSLNTGIKQKEGQIAEKQKDIDRNYEKLKDRLRALYLAGDASTLEVVLNAKNMMDLADKAMMLQTITEHDTELIQSIRSEMKGIQQQKAQIEKDRDAVSAAKKEYDAKQAELTNYVNQANQALAKISQDESSAEAQSREIAKQEDAASAAVDAWYQEYYASLNQNNGGGGSGGGGSSGSGSGGYVSSGQFQWPVPSCTNVTSGFGPRWGSFHKGIDISRGGIYGAAIVAADSGRVIQAGFGNHGTGYGGYGNVVAIDHGGGYSTLYAHMSRVAVSVGQQVKKGQVIGAVGSTGDSTGPHLHFEIRVNGVAKNPLNWF